MIRIAPNFPQATGNTEEDIDNIFDFLYKLERELQYTESKVNEKIRQLELKINELEDNNGQ